MLTHTNAIQIDPKRDHGDKPPKDSMPMFTIMAKNNNITIRIAILDHSFAVAFGNCVDPSFPVSYDACDKEHGILGKVERLEQAKGHPLVYGPPDANDERNERHDHDECQDSHITGETLSLSLTWAF